jgi:hypothetical protein
MRSVRRLLVTASVVPSSQILVTLMMESLSFSETSVLTRATLRNISEDAILHNHRRENLKSYNFEYCTPSPEPFRFYQISSVLMCPIYVRNIVIILPLHLDFEMMSYLHVPTENPPCADIPCVQRDLPIVPFLATYPARRTVVELAFVLFPESLGYTLRLKSKYSL